MYNQEITDLKFSNIEIYTPLENKIFKRIGLANIGSTLDTTFNNRIVIILFGLTGMSPNIAIDSQLLVISDKYIFETYWMSYDSTDNEELYITGFVESCKVK